MGDQEVRAGDSLPAAALDRPDPRLRRVLLRAGPGPGRLRHLVRPCRGARPALAGLAERPARPRFRRGRGRAPSPGGPGRLLRLDAVDRRRAARRGPPRRARLRHEPRGRPRPGGRCAPRGRRRLGARVGPGPWRHGGRAAGRVQPAGPGLEPAALAARPARRGRLRAVPRHAARGAAARRGSARRPRPGAVPAVVGAAGSGPWSRYLRALRPRGAGRHPGPRGPPGRCVRHRRGPRRRRAVGARLPARARGLRHLDPVVREGPGRCPAGPRGLARAVPSDRDHPRPAPDRGLPGRRPHRRAREARAAH